MNTQILHNTAHNTASASNQQAALNAIIEQCALLKAALSNMINTAQAKVEIGSAATAQIEQLNLPDANTEATVQAAAQNQPTTQTLLTAHAEILNVQQLNEHYNQLLGAYRAVVGIEALATDNSHG